MGAPPAPRPVGRRWQIPSHAGTREKLIYPPRQSQENVGFWVFFPRFEAFSAARRRMEVTRSATQAWLAALAAHPGRKPGGTGGTQPCPPPPCIPPPSLHPNSRIPRGTTSSSRGQPRGSMPSTRRGHPGHGRGQGGTAGCGAGPEPRGEAAHAISKLIIER